MFKWFRNYLLSSDSVKRFVAASLWIFAPTWRAAPKKNKKLRQNTWGPTEFLLWVCHHLGDCMEWWIEFQRKRLWTSTTTSSGISTWTSLSVGFIVSLCFYCWKRFLLLWLKFIMSFIVPMTFHCHNTHAVERYVNFAKFSSHFSIGQSFA